MRLTRFIHRVSVLPVVAVAALCVGAALPQDPVAIAQDAKASVSAVTSDGKSWLLSRGDSAQTGVAQAKLPDKLALKWRFHTGEKSGVKATPIIADGKAFVGALNGQFFAIDIKTANKLWSFSTEDGPLPEDARPNEKKFADSIEASACYIDGKVYFGANDGLIYCLDATSGKLVWAHQTQDKVTAAPNWVKSPDGKSTWILVGSNDANLYCLDAVTGKEQWKYETGNIINGAPAVANGITVFGGCDGLVHMVNVKDGSKAGEVEINDYIAATAAMDGDRIFFGHHGNKFVCVDLKEKKIVWQYGKRDFPFMASAALTKEFVIVGGQDRRVHCLTRDGEQKWEFRTRGQFNSSPIAVGDRIVVGCDDGRLYMLDLKSGDEIWNYEVGQPVAGSPAVIDGLVLVGSDDGYVYAFGAE